MRVIVSQMLPTEPRPGEWARRFVRHGMADVLAWLGEPVGPTPDARTHAMVGVDPATPGSEVLLISAELHAKLKQIPRGSSVSWDIPGWPA